MSQSSDQVFFSRNGAANFSRRPKLQPPGDRLKAQTHLFDTSFDNGMEDHDSSTPSTPSLTTASSRSGPSSVCTCENCGYASQMCRCRELSDSSSLDFRHSEPESPVMYPLTPSYQKRDAMRFPKSLFLGQARSRSERSSFSQRQCASPRCPVPMQTSFSRSSDKMKGLGITSLSCQHPATSQNDFESDESEEDDYVNEDDEETEDDWSGQDTSLESVVLEALGGDLVLAAQLIPVLHKSFYCEFADEITRKVAPWANGITKCSDGGSDEQTNLNEQSENKPSNPRKRQRRFDSGNHGREQDDEDDDEDEDEKDPNTFGTTPENGAESPVLRLACPFYKRDPAKYCIQHDATDNTKRINYRTCEGPGFKSIQRLKEHLKRKHYPVQCDRCYQIFMGVDRADCVLKLQSHRQLATPCKRAEAALKEGISDAQWASLDKKKSSKRNQATSRVEKYWEIWDILFPLIPRPKTPWYDTRKSSSSPPPFSRESSEFSTLFTRMLELQVNQHHIQFPPGLEQEMITKVQSLVQKAFSLYVGIHGLPAAMTTSSSSTSKSCGGLQSSVFSGSYAQNSASTPRTSMGGESLRNCSPVLERGFALGHETGTQIMSVGDHRTGRNMGPPSFMTVPQMMPSQFVSTTPQQRFGLQSFVPGSFNANPNQSQGLGPGWGYMPFVGGAGNVGVNQGFGNGTGAGFPGGLSQTLFDGGEEGGQGLPDWESEMGFSGR